MNTRLRKKNILTAQALFILLFGFTASKSFGQASILWSNTASSTWQTNSNWTGSVVPTSTDIAQIGVNPTGTSGVGIDMGATTNNGTNNQAVGAVEMTSARSSAMIIGNLSTTNSGSLTLTGVTVNSYSNVIIHNSSAQSITFQNIQGSGTKTMNVVLANPTDNRILQDGSNKIVISAPITSGGANTPLSVSGSGSSEVDITNAGNTYSGNISLLGVETVFPADGCFGLVPSSVIANAITIDGGRMTANATYTLNSNRGIKIGNTAGTSISVKTGTTILTYNGVIADLYAGGSWGKQGGNVFQLGGQSVYTGSTSINNGTIRLINGNNRLPITTTLSIGQPSSTNVGTLDLNGFNQQIAGLSSATGSNSSASKNTVTTSSTPATLTIDGAGSFFYGDGSTGNSGVITGSVSLIKNNTCLQVLGDINTYTGSTTVNGGELRFSPNNNENLGSSMVTLNGGTLSTTGIASGKTLSFSTLNLSSNAVIKLESTNAHTLSFAGSSSISWTALKTLTITGWQGNYNNPAGSSGTVGKIFIGTSTADLLSSQLSQIVFFDGTTYYPAMLFSTGELVPFYCTPVIPVNSTNGPICAGATLNFNAAVTSTQTLAYAWAGPNSFTSSLQNPSISGASAAASGVYTLTITNSCGSFTSTANATVNALPTVSANTSTASVCAGQSITLSGSGANTYTWANAGVSNGVAFAPNASNIYSVTGTDNNLCSNSATVNITVNSLPTVAVTSATTCAGTATSILASGASTYSWNTGATTNSVSLNPSSTTSYTVTGFSSFGCASSATTQLRVNNLPVLSLNAPAICAGNTATLSVSGANTYTWSTGSNSASILDAPATNSVYTVSGTSTLGCVQTNTVLLIVNALPSLTVPVITICSGGTATLSVSGANSYTWNTSSNSPTITDSPTITTTYTVNGTSLQGCINSASTSVIVTNSPSMAVNAPTICTGQTATLIASGVATYTWSTNANTSSISVTPTSTAIYTVTGNASACAMLITKTVTVLVNSLPTISANSATICSGATATLIAGGASTYTWNGSTASGTLTPSPTVATVYTVSGTSSLSCVNSATAQVFVITTPTITANSATICAGNSATLTASGSSFSYSWSTGATTASISISPATSVVYTVSSTNLNCTGTNTTAVTVNTLPVISTATASVCAGGTVALSASGASSYTWSTNSTTSNIVVTPTVNTSYTVSGTSSQGCSNSATTSVTVSNAPVISIPSASICAGKSATLAASGVSTYTWVSGPVTSTYIVTPSATHIYTINGNIPGCSVLATNTVAVVVNTLPVVAVNSASICQGGSVTLTASGASTYSWSNTLTTASISITPTTTTVYSVTGISAQGCTGTTNATVTVRTLPVVSLSISNTLICTNDAALPLAGTPAGGAYSGTGVSGNVFTPSSAGSFTINYSYTDANNCMNSAAKQVSVSACTSISENKAAAALSVYPNPAQEQLQISHSGFSGAYALEIFDMAGRSVFSARTTETNTTINVSDLKQGLYVLILSDGTTTATTRFIKN